MEYAPWWMLEVIGSWWHLTFTLDPESYFRIFPAQAIPFEWLYRATLFLVWWYIFTIPRSQFSFKVMGSRSRSRQCKAVVCNSKTTGRKLPGLGQNICRSNSELLTFWPWPLTYLRIFPIQVLNEHLKLAASFSVWRYIFRISRPPSSSKVMGLISRSRSWLQSAAPRRFVLPLDPV